MSTSESTEKNIEVTYVRAANMKHDVFSNYIVYSIIVRFSDEYGNRAYYADVNNSIYNRIMQAAKSVHRRSTQKNKGMYASSKSQGQFIQRRITIPGTRTDIIDAIMNRKTTVINFEPN